MTTYTVCNQLSGFELGAFEANSPSEAIDAACVDAGYKSLQDAIEQAGREAVEGLVAFERKS